MKKIIVSLLFSIFALSFYSCRETTQDKTKDAVDAIGEDIEDGARKAGDKLEEGAEKVKQEVDEEIHNTDDVNGEEANDDF